MPPLRIDQLRAHPDRVAAALHATFQHIAHAGNAGEGSITVQAIYADKSGKQVSKIMSEGKIGSGAFGGSMDFAIQKAAQEIAQYTLTTFK